MLFLSKGLAMVLSLVPEKTRAIVDLVRRFGRVDGNRKRHVAFKRPDENEDWRRYLGRDPESLRRTLNLNDIGGAEDETDPEVCMLKGEVLLRAGRADYARPFLRQAPRLAPYRQAAGAIALRAASQDLEFQHIIEEADRARDAAEWKKAAELYRDALRAFPEHSGYMVQYAHCLKEQGQFAEAECQYRSALTLGAPTKDIDEHLAFVAIRQGYPAGFDHDRQDVSPQGDPLDAMPTKSDIELVVFLLLGREPRLAETLDLLRAHVSLRSLMLAIMEQPGFVTANPRLLSKAMQRLIPERGPT